MYQDKKYMKTMKKFNIIFMAIVLALGFYACQDDETITINPEAEAGTLSFILNNPQYSNYTYVLEEANNSLIMDTLITSQPDYGFSAKVNYFVQVSFDDNMADFIELASSVVGENVTISIKDMNKAMLALYKGTMPNPTVAKDIFIRLKAIVSEATPTPLDSELTVKPLFSNAVKLNIMPYFMEDLVSFDKAKKIVPWYIIGLGDGNWSNDVTGLGVSVFPMSVAPGNWFDTEGDGKFILTSYIKADQGFKFIRDFGNWDIQWGNSGGDGINKPVYKDGGSANFKVPSDGYYTITLNSIKNEMEIEKAEITPNLYASMGLIGEMTGWSSDVVMHPFQTQNNHLWYLEYTFDSNSEFKFRANAAWGSDWGGLTFPMGLAAPDNIKGTAGTYMIMYNDIDGFYYFYKK